MENRMENNKETFEYTYSAKQQQEIESIRKKYLPKEEDKMERIRKLDREAERPGMIASLATGVIGALILGIGMCCTMVWGESLFVLGIFVGVLGIALTAAAYPLYKKVTKTQREKVAEQILALTNELSL
ncbi:MAG: hypothetical protein PUJ55_12445 [Clostridiales bacterium]|nr:hypothetical protein [Roseburia sp.]MDD7637730.1 hypothetical protein [Clostridiales bacterium]MDY4111387.1 hypothetical protein [Roseburia sp.]